MVQLDLLAINQSQAAYDAYTGHPDHVAFVEDRWNREVTDFMEIDFMEVDSVP